MEKEKDNGLAEKRQQQAVGEDDSENQVEKEKYDDKYLVDGDDGK